MLRLLLFPVLITFSLPASVLVTSHNTVSAVLQLTVYVKNLFVP